MSPCLDDYVAREFEALTEKLDFHGRLRFDQRVGLATTAPARHELT